MSGCTSSPERGGAARCTSFADPSTVQPITIYKVPMTDEEKRRSRKTTWLLLLVAFALMLAIVVVPPLLSIGRYKSQITRLVSSSLGRPVHLSSVELRLFPRPGFVLTDLTVDEDPAYGAEPVLHANTVTVAIRLLSLWRGRLEISRISVDEASLNIVRTEDNQWNLDPFFRTAAARTNGAAAGTVPPIPYLEATNSRVHIKKGLEKLPFSLVNADLSFWQENPGDWRLRLRGQPARTDVALDLADTGVVRLEATLRRAPKISSMPIHMEMEWREAQLGQLSRLIVGSDPGWRGDLTGQLQLDGTAETAQVRTRLSATNVHRAEFAPADALDFDANCAFVYHYSNRSVENLSCDSPLGDGHIKLAGDLPADAAPKLSVNMQRIPVGAGLDLLRTLRDGIDPDLEVRGTVSGELAYDPITTQNADVEKVPRWHTGKSQAPEKGRVIANDALRGSLVIDGFSLSGGALTQPLSLPKLTWTPGSGVNGTARTVATTASLPAGGASPLTVAVLLSTNGYEIDAHGPIGLPRLRELVQMAGLADDHAFSGIVGGSAAIDLKAHGTWLPTQSVILRDAGESQPLRPSESEGALSVSDSDQLEGTVTLQGAKWKSDLLSNDVQITTATLDLGAGKREWNPVVFQYGPVNGSASVQMLPNCEDEECVPKLAIQFSELDAAALQAALLGAQKQDSAFSGLVARFTQNRGSGWPRLDATVKAGSISLGRVNLLNAVIAVRVLPTMADITSIEAGLLGGELQATGSVTNGDKPAYSIEGSFSKVTGQALCQMLLLQCTGGPISGTGRIEVAGFEAADLASSATGTLHFDWRHGAVSGSSTQVSNELSHFDRWTADATVAGGAITLTQNQVQKGSHFAGADVVINLTDPPTIRFGVAEQSQAAKR